MAGSNRVGECATCVADESLCQSCRAASQIDGRRKRSAAPSPRDECRDRAASHPRTERWVAVGKSLRCASGSTLSPRRGLHPLPMLQADQALFGRLQTRRGQPFTDVRPNFGPPGSSEQFITQTAWPNHLGFFTQTLRFVGETLLYEVILLEMVASLLHRAAPFPSEAGAQPAFSSHR